MAHHTLCAPLLTNFFTFLFKTSNGAPGYNAPLLVETSNGAPQPRCATTNKFFFCKLVMAHHVTGAPLVTRVTNGALLGGAPLVT